MTRCMGPEMGAVLTVFSASSLYSRNRISQGERCRGHVQRNNRDQSMQTRLCFILFLLLLLVRWEALGRL